MLMREEPHLVVAFPHSDSVGTWHCAVAAECPALVCLLGAGVRDAIAARAREWDGRHLVPCWLDGGASGV